MVNEPLISIVIPSFQQASELEGALQSIAQQTKKDYEIIVIDGNSQDNTREIINQYAHLPIIFKSEPDKGIYDAMNKGVSISSGKYIYFLGCDDRLAADDVLEKIFSSADVMQNHVVYGDVIFTDTGARYNGEFNHFELFAGNICHQAIFTQKKVFENLGKFDTRYKTYADWEFNMRWFNEAWVKRLYIPVIIANFNTAGFSSKRQDEVFFAEEKFLKEKYFPRIVRYLISNLHRPLHWRLMKLLTVERLMIFQKLARSRI